MFSYFFFRRNRLVSQLELSNRFSDIRFLRLPAIKYENNFNILVNFTHSAITWSLITYFAGFSGMY